MKFRGILGGRVRARLIGLLLLAGLTEACANENAVFRTNSVPTTRPHVITEDAKQRNTYVVPDLYWTDGFGKGKKFASSWRVCSEAAPDVFSALSTSAGADLGFNQSGTDTEAAAKLAIALSESAGTIERTQTINLLRESMYRTCERWISNAITKEAFIVQAGRDWRAMIAILAIEQLTRTARPPATVLVPSSTNATITSPTELAIELRRSAVAAENARMAKEKADQAVKDAACPATAPAADAAEDAKKKWADCVALKQAAADAAAEVRRAEAAEKALREATANNGAPGGSVAASTGDKNNNILGGSEQVRSASDLQAVALSVERIVMQAFKTDETQLFCLQRLAPLARGQEVQQPEDDLRNECIKYLMKRVEAETQRIGLSNHLEADSQALTTYLGSDEAVALIRWRNLLQASQILESAEVLDRIKTRLGNAATLAEITAAYSGSGTRAQEIIGQYVQNYRW